MYKDQLIKILRALKLPGSKDNIVKDCTLEDLSFEGNVISIKLNLKSPAMHLRKKIEQDILHIIHERFDSKAQVKFHSQVKLHTLPLIRGMEISGVKNIIAIASGKGGVGKSTVSANIAVSLAMMGFKTGLLDADIYGPSIPLMLDVESARPLSTNINGKEKIIPVDAYGLSVLSMGFFAGSSQAVIWRGPMATKVLRKLIRDAHWGELDFLIVDLPPGTGDIHLSLMQEIPLTAVVIVSTPQKIALSDVRKSVAMFHMEAINVPVLGMIENMAYFSLEGQPELQYPIFGNKGAQEFASELTIPFLGEIPIIQSIREASDVGRPAALQKNTFAAERFMEITKKTVEQLVYRNTSIPPTEALRITTMAGCKAK
ncbi:Mrp/NBP35 family ATP-binding protein [Bacteroidetes bacterium endosymbiont of Geopemphigus sp.]|uniref:Mrp/NBP35 family ATP-binding protein n=1 Tax=Bacteroidetes bacterium endosymbiont of Geopemphigus sp. TaxID=2047937 RepID=UPI000CD20AD6|nr:Mrp/NBP35 family ATP-binding protein [Bacteroidetes bacterium endosymbiont of Geopemphigus sp.]